jgi:hypothetical protein
LHFQGVFAPLYGSKGCKFALIINAIASDWDIFLSEEVFLKPQLRQPEPFFTLARVGEFRLPQIKHSQLQGVFAFLYGSKGFNFAFIIISTAAFEFILSLFPLSVYPQDLQPL